MADPGRREFLKKTSAGIISGVAATNQTTADAVVPLTKRELTTDVSQRQTPPDDGKKYGWLDGPAAAFKTFARLPAWL